MTDYIQRDTTIELMKKEAAEMSESFEELGGESGIYAEAYEDAANMLQDMPAADVAEVVRCKNCKWFADNNGGEWYGCKMFQVVRITPEDAPKPDDFCSYGERREGGNDNVSD